MKQFALSLSLLFLSIACSFGQEFKSAGEYLTYIGTEYRTISSGVLSYTSAVAHGKSARKVEKRRTEMIANIKNAEKKVAKMPDFKGDASLRDSAVVVLKLNYIIINEDYSKIVDMEAVAEQSYDAMEAYLLAQDLASDKLEEAGDRLTAVQDAFIAANGIQIIDNKDNDELLIKMKKLNEVNNYHRKVYLTFFKSYKQELYMIEAMNKADLNALEQNKNSLLAYAEEGLGKMDTMKTFNSDLSLVNACKEMLTFYKEECQTGIPVYVDFQLKQENFQKVKAAFEAKKEKERTQEDIDSFNNAVKDVNDATTEYNKMNDKLNKDRAEFINKYNTASSKFMDKHVPHF
jgi:hypothetical protein